MPTTKTSASKTPARKGTTKPQGETLTVNTRMGSMNYDVVDVPVITRDKAENPHAEGIARVVASLNAGDPKALSIPVPFAQLKTHRNFLRFGGNDAGVTIRITESKPFNAKGDVTPAEDGTAPEDTMVRLTFWAVPKITKQRKTAEEKAAEKAAE